MENSSTIRKSRPSEELGIKKHFSMSYHPQANGQVESVNKTIEYTLKRKLDISEGA